MAAITIMDSLSKTIKEEIDPTINETLPELDPTFKQIARSSVGVTRDGIGRDWKKIQVFSTSIAGTHTWRSAAGGSLVDGLGGRNLQVEAGAGQYGTGSLRTWQTLDQMTTPGFVQRYCTLVQGYGNFHVPLDVMRTDKLDASVGSVVAQITKGAAKREALSQVHAFWKLGHASTYTPGAGVQGNLIGTITSISASAQDIPAPTSAPVECKLQSGRIRSFFPGLLIDIFAAAGTSVINSTNPVVVMRVDYLKKSIWIKKTAGSAASNGIVANTASPLLVLPWNNGSTDLTSTTASYSPSGLVDWIKMATTAESDSSPTTSVFGINLKWYPQFSSIVDTSLSGALTSDVLNKYIGGFSDAYGSELDTILTTPGVILGFLENIDSGAQLLRYDTQGEALAVEAGFMPFGYVHDGKKYRIMTSPNCPTGVVYVLKLGDKNIQKIVPPRLDGVRSDSKFSSEIEFVAPVFGGNGIFMPAYNTSGQLTDAVQAPYLTYCEFMPKMVQGIKIGTFAENIYTAS